MRAIISQPKNPNPTRALSLPLGVLSPSAAHHAPAVLLSSAAAAAQHSPSLPRRRQHLLFSNMASSDKASENSTSSSSSNAPHLAFTTISNVKLHVPIQLSFSQPHYKKWSRLFLLLVRRFTLHGFLSGSTTPSSADDDEWYQLDALIQGWILSTITDKVSDLVISTTTTAAELWQVIHALFHDNKHARAMQLEHQFRTTIKGSITMATYCQTLRNIADWLDDVDAPVSEPQLVLQMLRGLPDDLQAQTLFLQFQQPLPTFLQTRSALMLLERQRQTIMDDADTALIAGRTASSPYGGGSGGFGRSGGTAGSGQNGSSGGSRGQQGRNSGRGGGGRGRGRGRNSGINVHRTAHGLFLHQTQFTHDILERAGMITCRPTSTHVNTKAKLSGTSGSLVADPALYRSIVGALQYLTFTRPDISDSVQQICLHLHAPREVHVTAMKRDLKTSVKI
ncbi:unnamed protein product [Cuscuta campestris]|uniref:Reverse transcriptase Ty1/copia-type domain-containing protein n=1 Tax=Cuscuta campestris TaxID=132261 RepID=A0A484LFF8_9ASTE|nr:unnamed protein product [Cuscuta campestris]